MAKIKRVVIGHSEGMGVKTGLHPPPPSMKAKPWISHGEGGVLRTPPPLDLALAIVTDKIMTTHMGYVYSVH